MLLSIPTLKQTDGWNENAHVTSVHGVCWIVKINFPTKTRNTWLAVIT